MRNQRMCSSVRECSDSLFVLEPRLGIIGGYDSELAILGGKSKKNGVGLGLCLVQLIMSPIDR